MDYEVMLSAEQKAVVSSAVQWGERAAAYPAIVDDVSYEIASEDLKAVKATAGRLEEARVAITGPLNKALKAANDLFRGPADRLANAERSIKAAIGRFVAERERLAAAAQAEAEEVARKERAKLLARAEKAEVAGKMEKATALEAAASAVVAPVVNVAPPKVAGLTTRDQWRWECTDADAVPREYLTLDEARIRKVVSAFKGDTKIPGIRVWCEKVVASSRG